MGIQKKRLPPCILLIFFFFFLLTAYSGCTSSSKDVTGSFSAVNGKIDLSGWDVSNEPVIYLTGEWEFYYNSFYTYEDFHSDSPAVKEKLKDERILGPLPGMWNSYEYKGKKLPGKGYGTYRLRVILPEDNEMFSVKVPGFTEAYSLYINTIFMEGRSKAGKTADESVIWPLSLYGGFREPGNYHEIIIHVSNFYSQSGGLTRPVKLAHLRYLLIKEMFRNLVGALYIGALLIMAIYHFTLFLLRKEKKAYLYFSLFCFFFMWWVILIEPDLFYYLTKQIHWLYFAKINQILINGIFFVFLVEYIYSLYPSMVNPKIVRSIEIMYCILTFLIIIIPFQWLRQFVKFSSVLGIYPTVYLQYVMIKTVIKKEKGAWYTLIGHQIIVISGFVELLLFITDSQIEYSTTALGVLICIILLPIALAARYTNAYKRVKLFSRELEHKVIEKTEELQSKNSQIMDSIAYAGKIQSSILPTPELLTKFCTGHFVIYKPKDVVGGDFYWIKEWKEQDFLLAVGDCTGHGVPGAFMSMAVTTLLNRIVEDFHCFSPADILSHLNALMHRTLNKSSDQTTDDGLDIALLYCSRADKKITFAGAKLSLMYMHEGIVREIRGDKQSIGYMGSRTDFLYTNHELTFDQKTAFYLTSDGIIHQNSRSSLFPMGRNNFISLLTRAAEVDFENRKNFLLTYLQEYMGDEEQLDDITIVGFRL